MANGRNIELHDVFCTRTLAGILTHHDKYDVGCSWDVENECKILGEAHHAIMVDMLARSYHGVPLKYKQVGARSPVGRYISCDFGTQGMKRTVRHTICHAYRDDRGRRLFDLDIANCHPALLSQYCARNDIECDVLNKYIADRKGTRARIDEFLSTLVREKEEPAKSRLLALMYGGNLRPGEDACDELVNFKAAMSRIHTRVVALNQSVYAKCKRSKRRPDNLPGSCCSLVMQDLENQALMAMYDAVAEMPDVTVTSLQFDGMLVLAPESYDINAMCDKLAAAIRNRTSYDLGVEPKEFDERFEVALEHLVDPLELIKDVDLQLAALRQQGPKVLDSLVVDYILERGHHLYRGDHWCIFNGRRWVRDYTDTLVSRYVAKLMQDNNGAREEKFYSSVVRGLKSRADSHIVFDADPNLLGFDDVVYDLSTGTTRSYDKDTYVAMSTGFTYAEMADVGEFMAEEVMEALRKIYPDATVLDYVLGSLSDALWGYAAPRMHIHHGPGSNGKSFLLTTMVKALGEYGAMAHSSILNFSASQTGPQPHIVQLSRRRLVALEEADSRLDIRESLLKDLVGCDVIHARECRSNITQHPMCANLYLLCNTVPRVDALTGGGRRRLSIVPHNSIFKDQDDDPDNHVYRLNTDLMADPNTRADWQKALLWIVLNTRRCKLGEQRVMPDAVDRATQSYFADMCVYRSWFHDSYARCECENPDSCKSHIVLRSSLKTLFTSSKEYDSLSRADKRAVSVKAVSTSLDGDSAIKPSLVVAKPVRDSYYAGWVSLV
jgi:hypothetical protein